MGANTEYELFFDQAEKTLGDWELISLFYKAAIRLIEPRISNFDPDYFGFFSLAQEHWNNNRLDDEVVMACRIASMSLCEIKDQMYVHETPNDAFGRLMWTFFWTKSHPSNGDRIMGITEVIEPCLETMGFTQNEVLQALRQVLAEMHGSDI